MASVKNHNNTKTREAVEYGYSKNANVRLSGSSEPERQRRGKPLRWRSGSAKAPLLPVPQFIGRADIKHPLLVTQRSRRRRIPERRCVTGAGAERLDVAVHPQHVRQPVMAEMHGRVLTRRRF